MSKANLTKQANITTSVRELDFVSRFAQNWNALMILLGIMRPIEKTPGTKLVANVASVELQPGNVGEGEEIPYSLAEVRPVAFADVEIEKYAKAVSIEAVNKYGAQVAIEKTDDAFLNELQKKVLTKFYTFLKTGTLLGAEATFQMALAMAKARVLDKFNKMRKDVTEVVGFCNVLDVYQYIGAANVTVQTQFGLNYIENFMGYKTLFLLSAPDIPRGMVIALPVENIDLYYVNPGDSQFARLGLEYTTDGVTNLIGFHAMGNYSTAVGECYALMGMTLWAEFIDGISVITINTTPLADLTIAAGDKTTLWGTDIADIQENISVADGAISGTLKYYDDETKTIVRDWGKGYFLYLKFSNFASGVTYSGVQVGLCPSEGTGLVTLDNECDALFHLKDKDVQSLQVIQTNSSGKKSVQYVDLSGLTLVKE